MHFEKSSNGMEKILFNICFIMIYNNNFDLTNGALDSICSKFLFGLLNNAD